MDWLLVIFYDSHYKQAILDNLPNSRLVSWSLYPNTKAN